MMKGLAARAFVAAFLPLVACTTVTEWRTTNPPSEEPGPPDPSGLPEVSAEDLGQTCAGFGTGSGETALFSDDKCPAGSCLVDGRTFELYCSADCTKVRCPSGYQCEAVTRPKGTYACFRDPSAPPPDGGTLDEFGYPTDHIGSQPRQGDVRGDRIDNLSFTGFTPGSTKTTTIRLVDYYDPKGEKIDVIFLALAAVVPEELNDAFAETRQAIKNAKSFPRLAVIQALILVLVSNDAPTLDDLTAFHEKYPWGTNVLDPGFNILAPVYGAAKNVIHRLPDVVAIDARTMEIIVPDSDMKNASEVDAFVDEIRNRPPAY